MSECSANGAALQAGAVDAQLPLAEIGAALVALVVKGAAA